MQSEVIGGGWCFKGGAALKESGAGFFVPIHTSRIQLGSGGCEGKKDSTSGKYACLFQIIFLSNVKEWKQLLIFFYFL